MRSTEFTRAPYSQATSEALNAYLIVKALRQLQSWRVVLVVDPLVASSVAFATKSRLRAHAAVGSYQEAQCSVPSVVQT